MAIIIDGKALAAKCKEEVRTAVAAMERKPGLAVILVGENPASQVYVRNKQKDCQECGIHSEEFVLPADYGQPALLTLIAELNRREDIDGILLEGGGTLNEQALAQDIVQEVQVYIAPKIIGGAEAKTPVEGKGVPDPNGAYRFAFDRMEQVGDDILLRYRKEKREICLQES